MRVLVTGGLGFLGLNLVNRLLRRGDRCRIFDNFSVGVVENLERMLEAEKFAEEERARVDVVRGDVLDAEAIAQASEGCTATVHLAALTNVVASVERPAVAFRSNAIGTLNVLEAARQQGVGRVVLASSNAAVGEVEPPIHEEIAPEPISAYGASKLAGEALASGYSHSYGMHAVSLRFSNVYGPYSFHKESVVSRFMKRILRGETLELFDAGRPTRDYIHVSDIVQAIEKGLAADRPGRVYQIGTGVETSTRRLVEILGEVTGYSFDTNDAPPRAGEITRNVSDVTRARRELAFEPQIGLDEGVQRLWPWFRAVFAQRD